MTPKEKAEELVEKMYHSQIYDENEKTFVIMTWERAKQCALIAVDEILSNSIDYNAYDGVSGLDMWIDNEYWEEVKKEIEKL